MTMIKIMLRMVIINCSGLILVKLIKPRRYAQEPKMLTKRDKLIQRANRVVINFLQMHIGSHSTTCKQYNIILVAHQT